MTLALFVVIGLFLIAALLPIWRSRAASRARRRHRMEEELRSQGFDSEGIRRIQQLRSRSSLLGIGDTLLLVSLAVGVIMAVRFPTTGPFLVLVVAAALIRGLIKNSKRPKNPGQDRS